MKDKIISEFNRRHELYMKSLGEIEDPRSKAAIDLIARMRELTSLTNFVNKLPDE